MPFIAFVSTRRPTPAPSVTGLGGCARRGRSRLRALPGDSNDHYANFSYDALGRQISEQSNWTTRTSQYDLTGRRTRLTWGDGFFVSYDYNVTGEVTAIRENGTARRPWGPCGR